MFRLSPYPAVLALVILLFTPGAFAFGAGNIAGISKVKGVNWRRKLYPFPAGRAMVARKQRPVGRRRLGPLLPSPDRSSLRRAC